MKNLFPVLAFSAIFGTQSAFAGLLGYSGASASITNDFGGCSDSVGIVQETVSVSYPIGWATLSVEDLTIKSFLDLSGETGRGRTSGIIVDAFVWGKTDSAITVSMDIMLDGSTSEPYAGLNFGLHYSLTELILRAVDGAIVPGTQTVSDDINTAYLQTGVDAGVSGPDRGPRFFDLTRMYDLTLSPDAVGVVFIMGHQSEVRGGGFSDFGNTAGFQLTVPDSIAGDVSRDSGFQFVNGGDQPPVGSIPTPSTLLLFAIGGLSALYRRKSNRKNL